MGVAEASELRWVGLGSASSTIIHKAQNSF